MMHAEAREVASGERYGELAQRNPISALNDRERKILTLVASGLSNKRIALMLNVSDRTVKGHMTHIMVKLKVANRTEAAIALLEAGRN